MHPDRMRLIDRWVGIPLCFVASFVTVLKKRRTFSSGKPNTIYFIGIAEIGALIVSYPAVTHARKLFPDSRICFLTAPAGMGALELMGFSSHDIQLLRTSSLLDIFRDLLKIRGCARGSAALVLEPFTRISALLSRWIGADVRVGCHRFLNEGGYLGGMFTHRIVYNPHLHASQLYVAMVNAVGEPPSKEPMLKKPVPSQVCNRLRVDISEAEQKSIRDRLQQLSHALLQRIVLLNANASDIVPLRKWPMERFVELGRVLLADKSLTLVLTGSAEERQACETLKTSISSENVVNFAGETSFRELIALYTISSLLITNDSGPVHFASTTNLPQIALFGPETPNIFGPLSTHAKPLWLGLACSPCISVFNQKKSACSDNRCLKDISVSMVHERVMSILSRG